MFASALRSIEVISPVVGPTRVGDLIFAVVWLRISD
jgi:hypothetical protein